MMQCDCEKPKLNSVIVDGPWNDIQTVQPYCENCCNEVGGIIPYREFLDMIYVEKLTPSEAWIA